MDMGPRPSVQCQRQLAHGSLLRVVVLREWQRLRSVAMLSRRAAHRLTTVSAITVAIAAAAINIIAVSIAISATAVATSIIVIFSITLALVAIAHAAYFTAVHCV